MGKVEDIAEIHAILETLNSDQIKLVITFLKQLKVA